MADLTHSDLTLHAVRDESDGYLHFVVDYDGIVIPVQTVPLGLLDSLKAAAENDVHPGISSSVVAPSKAAQQESSGDGEQTQTQEQ